MRVGFIGLGRMGQGMARRILDAGHALTVYNRTREKTEALEAGGARVAASVAALCLGQDVVVTMLADDTAIWQSCRDEGGIVQSLPRGAIHMASGTHSVAVARALARTHAAAGRTYCAVPVLGRPDRAAAGELDLIAAGPGKAIERLRPLFEALGRRTFDAGADPMGAAAIKIAHNMVLGCAMEAVGEGMALVRKYGVEAKLLHEVLTEGVFGCLAYRAYGEMIANDDYDSVGITATLGLKDADLAQEAGAAAGVPLPSGNAWRDRLVGAIAHGDGERDWSVVAREQARASGLV